MAVSRYDTISSISHYFRVDKPVLDASGRRLENFTRVETFGDNQGNGNNDVQWVKALVDPQSRDSSQRQRERRVVSARLQMQTGSPARGHCVPAGVSSAPSPLRGRLECLRRGSPAGRSS